MQSGARIAAVAANARGMAITGGTNGTVAAVDFLSSSRLAYVVDPADNVQLRTVAPGQLLSLFGADLAPVNSIYSAEWRCGFDE